MVTTTRASISGRDGFSLVEMLVSMLILALAATVALALYDNARRSFKVGENATEQQQLIRIAFDKMGSDLRMAGFNSNPDGALNRPDEQIEGAFANAVVIRADFDAADPAEAIDPELALASGGSPFSSVSTGNDEIVAYALAGPSSTDSLAFEADVAGAPRDGGTDLVQVGGLALPGPSGSYTLYRITLDDAGVPVRTPLIDNVRSLRFTYYDRAGLPVAPVGGAEDPTGRRARASIRRIGIEIEGLTRDPDLHWVDPTDPNPTTRRFRKFMLAGDVKPRNLGLAGMKDIPADSLPPAPPSTPVLHPGHCGGLYVDWETSPPEDEVAYYRLRYGITPGALTGQASSVTSETFLADLQDATPYYVVVEAVDDGGNVSAPSPVANAATRNDNTPQQALALSSAREGNGHVVLDWTRVTDNTEPVPGADPIAPRVRDLAGYRVYRSADSGFVPGQDTRIAQEDTVPAATTPTYIDAQPISCDNSYYRVAAVDACGLEGEPSESAFVASLAGTAEPKIPYNDGAYLHPDGHVRFKWRAVREDIHQNPIFVDKYQVFRAIGSGVPRPFVYHRLVTGTEFIDTDVPSGEELWYKLRAQDECGRLSEHSFETQATCWFPGDLIFQSPAYGTRFQGDLPLELRIVGGSDEGSYENLRLNGLRAGNGNHEPIVWDLPAQSPGFWSYVWEDYASGSPDIFELTALVDYVGPGLAPCTYSTSIFLVKEAP